MVLRKGLDKTDLKVCFTCLTDSLEGRKKGFKKKERKSVAISQALRQTTSRYAI